VENIADIERKHGGKEWENENRARGNERDHAHNRAIVAHINEPFLEPGLALLLFFRRSDWTRRQRSQRNDQRKKGHSVTKERGRGSPPTNKQASH
jgi:hypothetical protein